MSHKIDFLKKSKDLPHYAMNLLVGVEKAKKEGRDLDISANSLLFINRMYENRFGK